MTTTLGHATTMRTPHRFWDRIADRYAKSPVPDEAVYRRKLETTQRYLEPEMEVLEFGCGTGSTAIVHAPFVKHITAIDISARMIEIAKGKADAGKIANVSFEQGTIEDIAAPDQSYDVVLGLSILHLVENKDAVIAKVHRLLKPGGVFVSSTPCLQDTHPFLKIIVPIGRLFGLMPAVWFFTKTDLQQSLTRAGFAIDHQWQPDKRKAVFIVAKKAG